MVAPLNAAWAFSESVPRAFKNFCRLVLASLVAADTWLVPVTVAFVLVVGTVGNAAIPDIGCANDCLMVAIDVAMAGAAFCTLEEKREILRDASLRGSVAVAAPPRVFIEPVIF